MSIKQRVLNFDVDKVLDFDWVGLVNTSKFEIFLLVLILRQMTISYYSFLTKVPEFRSIFESMNVELPVITQGVLALSSFCAEWWFISIPFMMGSLLIPTTVFIVGLATKETYRENSKLGALSYLGLVALLIATSAIHEVVAYSLHTPFLKLINGVG